MFSRFIPSPLLTISLSLLIAAAIWCVPLKAAHAQTTELRIGGTGAGLGVMRELADAFRQTHPETKIKIMPSLGSNGGIKAVSAGILDIGISSRPLTESEQSRGVKAREISRTPFIVAIAIGTPVRNLTFADLAAIYNSEKKTWSGGTPVRPVLRPTRDTDTALLKAMSPEIAQAVEAAHRREGMNVAMTDTDIADVLERVPGAIGTTSLSQIISEKRRLKPIAVNGITPSVQALADNSYPYYKVLHLIIGPNPSRLAHQFVQFATSPAGAHILRKNGNQVRFNH